MKRHLIAASLSLGLFSSLIVTRADAQGCNFENKGYFDGQVACQYGTQMKCVGGSWVQTGNQCPNGDAEVRQPEATGPDEVQMPAEPVAPSATE